MRMQLEMDDQESKENRCRICLEENVEQDWNDLLFDCNNLTYKDCYYKFTQLEYVDEDNFSTMLCRNCCNGLEYVEAFISKAIETHVILQQLDPNILPKQEDSINQEVSNFKEIEKGDIKSESENATVSENSCQDFLAISTDNHILNTSEKCPTTTKQTKRKKYKSAEVSTKMKKLENVEQENFENQLTNDESVLDKKKKIPDSMCCSICSKVLSSKYRAISHEKTHMKNRERNETCVECGLKFYSKDILRQHMLTHLENREKTHKCEFCDKAFYKKAELKIHQRIHLGQMVPCILCNKEFYRQIDLDIHMSSHSAVMINSDVKKRSKYWVRCKFCNKNIMSTSFKSHTAAHLNEPLMKCSLCDKEYFRRDSCREHLKSIHKKTAEEYNDFIITYNKNRLSHLYLEQTTELRVNED